MKLILQEFESTNDGMLIKDNIKIVLLTLNFSNEQKIDMCHEL